MQFGLFMMPLHPPERSFAESYDRDLAQIVLADRLGYHEVWIGEHLTERWENAPAPELLIAQALLKTEKIILATGVTLLALHNPVEVAHRIAMLDHLARGRFYWGIGGGAIPTDLTLFGLDPSRPAEVRARSAEALDVILKLWASAGQFSYHGKFFHVTAPDMDPVKERGFYMKPYQKPHPPIGVAATSLGSGSIRLAGERGWIPMSSPCWRPSTSRITGAWWKPGPPAPGVRQTASSGALAAIFSWRKRQPWRVSTPARSWDEIMCGISIRIVMAPVRWQRQKLTRVCPTRPWMWTI